MTIKLKPCPFCGGKALGPTDAWPHMVTCEDCGASVKGFRFGETGVYEAIEKWNRREPDVIRQRLQVHNIGNVDIPEGVSAEVFYAIMNGVVEALEHTERGESWPYETTCGPDNDDLISRKLALESICFAIGMFHDADLLRKTISMLPAADVPTVNGWVSVKDMLPEIDERVLVFGVGKYEHFVGSTMTAITCMSDAN